MLQKDIREFHGTPPYLAIVCCLTLLELLQRSTAKMLAALRYLNHLNYVEVLRQRNLVGCGKQGLRGTES